MSMGLRLIPTKSITKRPFRDPNLISYNERTIAWYNRDMKYVSPVPMGFVLEQALNRNYKEMAELIEVSGKYELTPEDEVEVARELKNIQDRITNLQEVGLKYEQYVRSKSL